MKIKHLNLIENSCQVVKYILWVLSIITREGSITISSDMVYLKGKPMQAGSMRCITTTHILVKSFQPHATK